MKCSPSSRVSARLRAAGEPAFPAAGEVVFNTVMTGYQEVLTDPSYAGQMIAFTYPHIGNYGVVPDDDESRRPFCRGVIVRELTDRPSNWRATDTLAGFLKRHGLQLLAGIDTRRLTRQLRDAGSMPGAFGPVDGAPGGLDEAALLAAARAEPPTDGRDLVAEVTFSRPYRYGDGPFDVVAYDFGIKRNILRNLASIATVTVVPASTPAPEVIDRRPDGVFLSNGPGDPAAVAGATETVRALLNDVPVFGICLGHQILAQALGASTYKLPFGHHGGNHPVQRLETGTSGNYEPEPQLRRGGGHSGRCRRGEPRQFERRRDRGLRVPGRACIFGAVPPGGEPGPT